MTASSETPAFAKKFNYESRKEIIKVPKGAGINIVQGHLPGHDPLSVS